MATLEMNDWYILHLDHSFVKYQRCGVYIRTAKSLLNQHDGCTLPSFASVAVARVHAKGVMQPHAS